MHIRYIMKESRAMAEKLDHRQTIEIKELLMSKRIQSETLMNPPDKKGVISNQKLWTEIMRDQSDLPTTF